MKCSLTGKVLNDEESRQRGQDHGAGEEHQLLNDRARNMLKKGKLVNYTRLDLHRNLGFGLGNVGHGNDGA